MRVLALLALIAGFQSAQAADVYKIDPAHTSIVFKVNHMGFSNVYGMFNEADGKITIDEKAPEKSSFEVSVKADTVSTFTKKRDDHLKSPDFFNVKQFPLISLKSKSVKKAGDKFEVTGDLTLHGVTKPVAFTFSRMKTGKDPWGNIRTGGETTFKIKRTDFGMNFMSKPGEVGDEIELMISTEAVKQ